MMGVWTNYQDRIDAHGGSVRGVALQTEQRRLNTKIRNNLSYQSVMVYPQEYGYNIESSDSMEHSFTQDVAIINSDNMNEKLIITLSGEDVALGSLLSWMDNYWLVTERDANATVYVRARLLQCNHLLKWLSEDKELIEQWCVVEDGTKYLTGEYEDKDFFTTRGDTRISVQIARNKHTILLDRNRRFLIDDKDTPHKLAYALTKPFKRAHTYNDEGTFIFVMQEVTSNENDNHELGIADYYKYFPEKKPAVSSPAKPPKPPKPPVRKKVPL